MRKLDSLKAWMVGRTLAVAAYRLTLDPPLSRQFALSDQIRRSAGSIPANIAEGYALGTTAQFVRFLRIALGSTAELRTHLDLVRELELAGGEPLTRALQLCDEEIGLLIGLVYSLKRRLDATRPPSRVPCP